MVTYQQQVAELNAALQLQYSTARVFSYQHSFAGDEPTNLSNHYGVSAMLNTTPITVHNSSRPSSPPPRERPPSIERQEEPQLLKRVRVALPVIRSNHTEVERCSP